MELPCKILTIRLLISMLALSTTFVWGQNLVPNPSFETLKSCPTGSGQVELAEPWKAVLTPDLFNACSASATYRVPLNQDCNYLPAYEGKGYAGMFVYNSNEFLHVRLLDTLEYGKYYYVRFYVAPDEDCNNSSQPTTFTDGIGLGVKGTGPNDNYKVVAQNRGEILNDTMNWTKVSGCFIAEGNELELRIGNFLDDDSTLVETNMPQVPNSQQFNYMFVDEVVLAPFDPFPDTVLLCDGQPVNLDATFYDADIQWLTGDTSPVLLAFDTGQYVVIAEIDGCQLQEKVTVVNLDYSSLMPPDTSVCNGDEILISLGIPGIYLWENGSNKKSIIATKTDIYKATITNTCGDFRFEQAVQTEDCRCRLFVPNVFSPNGDGINDLLEIGLGCEYEYLPSHFEVYDRWGNLVFETDQFLVNKWDGIYKGKPAQMGTYTWFLTYELMYEDLSRTILEEGGVTIVY
jgi:gliding motility-associated-like protein